MAPKTLKYIKIKIIDKFIDVFSILFSHSARCPACTALDKPSTISKRRLLRKEGTMHTQIVGDFQKHFPQGIPLHLPAEMPKLRIHWVFKKFQDFKFKDIYKPKSEANSISIILNSLNHIDSSAVIVDGWKVNKIIRIINRTGMKVPSRRETQCLCIALPAQEYPEHLINRSVTCQCLTWSEAELETISAVSLFLQPDRDQSSHASHSPNPFPKATRLMFEFW